MKAKPRQMTRMVLTAMVLNVAGSVAAQAGPSVLFVRGADRSGGFLEAGNDAQRTEQLADINNTSTSGGNHGWFELAETLRGAGYDVTQITETAENASGPSQGLPVAFDAMDLNAYDAVVMGSNNAVYTTPQIDALEAYLRGGGGVIFISDANFGGNWADASDSDQQFLDRFGLVVHQDRGTYAIERANNELLVPDHPIFAGVDKFDGEGVTPLSPGTLAEGVSATILANAEGQVRLNNGTSGSFQGSSRAANANDAALLVASAGPGRIVGHFDRNTFFNLNGAGTNINRFDNRQYALNLFAFATTLAMPGDADGDGDIDDSDLGTAFANYTGPLPANTGNATAAMGDTDGDGDIDDSDLGTAFADYTGPLSPSNVPEPASVMVLSFGVFTALRRRRVTR
ncbi:MAG: hypothetical protein ACE37H_18565 [Phycisphaeraceae bacterium]